MVKESCVEAGKKLQEPSLQELEASEVLALGATEKVHRMMV